MDIKESLNLLHEIFKNKDWYDSTGVEEFDRLIVYCKYLNVEVWNSVPDKLGDRYVVAHFAASKPKVALPVQVTVKYVEPLEEYAEDKTPDINSLIRELERLEKACRGSNTLQDIFYEIHDGKNAVTNLRGQYPQVADSMEDLLKVYGFDVIYEELDG